MAAAKGHDRNREHGTMAELDVYRDWLEITDKERPLNHYQLLKLKKFEDDITLIRKNYRKLNSHVRKYSGGQYGKASQALLNELAKSMLCLTDARRKREYDLSLGRKEKQKDKKLTLEDLLIAQQIVDPTKLKKARDYANAVGLEIRDALVQQKLASPEDVMQLYAQSVGLPFLDLTDVTLDHELLEKVPARLARSHSCAPVIVDEQQLLVASPNPLAPEVEEELRLRMGMPIRTVLCTPVGINEVINKYYPRSRAEAELRSVGGAAANAPAGEDGGEGSPMGVRLAAGGLFLALGFILAFMGLEMDLLTSGIVGLVVGGLVVGVLTVLKK